MNKKNADAAMAEALRKQAEYHDAMAAYCAIIENAKSQQSYREMAESAREMAQQYQAWADEDAQQVAA